MGKRSSKLAGLAIGLLGQEIQRNRMHDPVEDAYASLEIFLRHRDLFEQAVLPTCSYELATLQDGQTFRLDQ